MTKRPLPQHKARSPARIVQLASVMVLTFTLTIGMAPQLASSFLPVPLHLADTGDLHDLGVADVNTDGFLDLFTSNHNARQSMLLGNGTLHFGRDAVSEFGLDHTRGFPEFERTGPPSDVSAPGIYLWREGNNRMVIHRVRGKDSATQPASRLSVTTYGPLQVSKSDRAEVSVDEGTDDAGRPTSVVSITLQDQGTVELLADIVGVPTEVAVEAPAEPGDIHIGPVPVQPPALTFLLELRDRHGMGWADVNDDGHKDVFITRGGLRNRLDQLPGLVEDELLLGAAGPSTDVLAETGISKGVCRGRHVAWVDIDGDGDLDLFVTCGGQPSQLWRRDLGLRFTDVSPTLPQDLVPASFVWHDVDGDRIPELVAARAGGIGVYRRTRAKPVYVERQWFPLPGAFNNVALADFNRDGFADVYFASWRGSVLLRGRAKSFRAMSPPPKGLPERARNAAWADVDGDGLVDLIAMPGGVYRQRPSGSFAATGLLDWVPSTANGPLVVAFDADDDGDRDVVLGYPTRGSKDWDVTLFENRSTSRWTQIELTGLPGNREAIGASVKISAGGLTSTHWVGESENSRYSQGSYRVYRGLGSTEEGVLIDITWPDGTVQTRRAAIDTVTRVRQPLHD